MVIDKGPILKRCFAASLLVGIIIPTIVLQLIDGPYYGLSFWVALLQYSFIAVAFLFCVSFIFFAYCHFCFSCKRFWVKYKSEDLILSVTVPLKVLVFFRICSLFYIKERRVKKVACYCCNYRVSLLYFVRKLYFERV
ncbi:hypothetical protein Cyrtocomes_00256 [Candidatus Cyrtobacter comes]|uniref:Uncharacterized protein n=1 Tax=Candidatus Cyrtobacter comes TaxID=675776 RepID=A0ABU5L6Z5_9RICK|nr:hypothetical protein [Candidatus Cyrtobacter comes]